MKKQISTILCVMFLALFATTFASCNDENDTIYGSLAVNGQVTDDQGNPIANAVVTLYNTGEGEYGQTAKTDTDGNYSLPQVKCTESIFLSVVAEGYQPDGISYQLLFSDGVLGVTLGTAALTHDFTLQKQ